MLVPYPIPLRERLTAASTRRDHERFAEMTWTLGVRKSDVRTAPGEITVLVRRPAAHHVVDFLGIRLTRYANEPHVVPSKLTIRSVRSWRVQDELSDDAEVSGAFSLYEVGQGRLHLFAGWTPSCGAPPGYSLTIEIDALDVELEDIS
jgi:hypothetical protein